MCVCGAGCLSILSTQKKLNHLNKLVLSRTGVVKDHCFKSRDTPHCWTNPKTNDVPLMLI